MPVSAKPVDGVTVRLAARAGEDHPTRRAETRADLPIEGRLH